MGIYVQGIDMPTFEKPVITINIYADGVVTNYAEKTIGTATQVQPHGRVIDADIFFMFVENKYKTAKGNARKAYSEVLDFICDESVDIIPADPREQANQD